MTRSSLVRIVVYYNKAFKQLLKTTKYNFYSQLKSAASCWSGSHGSDLMKNKWPADHVNKNGLQRTGVGPTKTNCLPCNEKVPNFTFCCRYPLQQSVKRTQMKLNPFNSCTRGSYKKKSVSVTPPVLQNT